MRPSKWQKTAKPPVGRDFASCCADEFPQFPSMLPLALSAFEKASKVPSSFWLKLFLVFVGLFLAVIVMRKLMQVNKFIFLAVGIVALVVLGFSWIYERNEPEFLTPLIDRIAPFFPAKGAYEVRQATDPTPDKQHPKH
jgi:hypothetical protein